ncbi:hypothetical protein EVAR_43029_1 [Eumeta japonica]|uniref:Uncharacterized protein n=1 Tax=Eumeta variegata TaxID=151549 RepID=A0A4C1XLJ5_EUMVA|nr:hypothetical protein EVAR_43029_1 [Eumeta japonica]
MQIAIPIQMPIHFVWKPDRDRTDGEAPVVISHTRDTAWLYHAAHVTEYYTGCSVDTFVACTLNWSRARAPVTYGRADDAPPRDRYASCARSQIRHTHARKPHIAHPTHIVFPSVTAANSRKLPAMSTNCPATAHHYELQVHSQSGLESDSTDKER